ncbi:MAG: hypothetical protein K6F27_08545 [Ruminococcus sp.]|nr:hypothetical protein [Ruminococcus sp.]
MDKILLEEQAKYDFHKSLQPLDNAKISSMIKSKDEVNAFIKEQIAKLPEDEKSNGLMIDNADLQEFMGKEFLELTEQPQHCALPQNEALLERVCEYYPDIFWAMYVHTNGEMPVYNSDVRRRKEYIYGHTRRKTQFLQALLIAEINEHEFWENYAYNMEHYKYKMYYKAAHAKREVPDFPTCFVTRVDRYAVWLRKIVDEYVDADYTYNADLTLGGMSRLYRDNRIAV